MQIHIIILLALILLPFPAYAHSLDGLAYIFGGYFLAGVFVLWFVFRLLRKASGPAPPLPPVSKGDRRKRNYWLWGILLVPVAIGAGVFLLADKIFK